MGEVWLARRVDPAGVEKLVVLKRLLSYLTEVPEFSDLFLQEARVTARLSHANIAQLYELIQEPEPCLVMEFVHGVPLHHVTRALRLASRPFPMAAACRIGAATAAGLHHAHALLDLDGRPLAIVHRDVSPQNLIVSFGGSVKLVDFGIAKMARSGHKTATGLLKGKIRYMSPEQTRGERLDGRSDIFALGVVLYELIVGETPFEGATDPEILRRLDAGVVRPPTAVRADVPPALERALLQALAPQRDGRFADAEEMQRALEAAERECPDRAEADLAGMMRALFPQRIQLEGWIRELQREESLEMRPTSVDRALRRSAPWTQRVGSRRSARRRRPWQQALAVVLAGLLAGALGSAAWWWSRVRLPGSHRLATIAVKNAGAPADDWIEAPLRRLLERKLGERELRFGLAPDASSANVEVRVAYRREAPGVTLLCEVGPKAGRLRALPPVHAAAVAPGLDQLLASLQQVLDAGQDAAAPDPAVDSEMARLGTRSRPALRLYQASVREFFGSSMSDTAEVARKLEEALRIDPAWPHALALLATSHGAGSAAERAALARAVQARADPARDPVGHRVLMAMLAIDRGRSAEAAAGLDEELRQHPDDVLVGWVLMLALDKLHRRDEWIGVAQRLHTARPDLQFGVDVAGGLRQVGRAEDVERLVGDWLRRAPENEQALSAQITIALERDRFDQAEGPARNVVFLLGEAPHRRAMLADVLLHAERAGDAREAAYPLLRGGALDRARGHLRIGESAILEGRFAHAHDAMRAAVREGRGLGLEGASRDALEALRALASVMGLDQEARQHTGELAALTQELGYPTSAQTLRYEAQLGGGRCPPMTAQTAGPPEGRDAARTDLLRAAAEAGCARCADVVQAGRSASELSARSLYRFGVCAEKEGALELARDAFEQLRRVRTWATHPPPHLSSTVHSILARYHLARVLSRLGKPAEARHQLESFLARWEHADRPLAEVADARKRLAGLTR